MSDQRAPDLILKAMHKTTGAKSGRLGCAWINEKSKTISIQLDPGVAIVGGPEIAIMLFQRSEKVEASERE